MRCDKTLLLCRQHAAGILHDRREWTGRATVRRMTVPATAGVAEGGNRNVPDSGDDPGARST